MALYFSAWTEPRDKSFFRILKPWVWSRVFLWVMKNELAEDRFKVPGWIQQSIWTHFMALNSSTFEITFSRVWKAERLQLGSDKEAPRERRHRRKWIRDTSRRLYWSTLGPDTLRRQVGYRSGKTLECYLFLTFSQHPSTYFHLDLQIPNPRVHL